MGKTLELQPRNIENAFEALGIDLPDMVKSSRATMINVSSFLIKNRVFEDRELDLLLADEECDSPLDEAELEDQDSAE